MKQFLLVENATHPFLSVRETSPEFYVENEYILRDVVNGTGVYEFKRRRVGLDVEVVLRKGQPTT